MLTRATLTRTSWAGVVTLSFSPDVTAKRAVVLLIDW